jgi:hypothetical protein
VQIEAVRAAGQLELGSAREELLKILEDFADLDVDLKAALVWSLSQIGGDGVQEALDQLYDETEDDDEAEYIEAALDNLQFTDSGGDLTMMGLPVDEDDLLNTIIDVNEKEGDEESGNHKRRKRKTD